MKARRVWGWSVLAVGCAVPAGETPPHAVGPMVRTEAFELDGLARAVTPQVMPAGAGVTVRWEGTRSLAVTAETGGLGPVTEVHREASGDVTLTHGDGVQERWASASLGVEQSWRYSARPAGDRVAVTVSLTGASLDHVADDGLWLRTATGELLRYGHATWVDAEGRRTAVPARWDGARVAMNVPASVVAASTFPAVLDPMITPAFAMEASGEVYNAPNDTRLVRTTAGSLVFTSLTANVDGTVIARPVMVQRLDSAHAKVPGSFREVPGSDARTGSFWTAASGNGAWVVWQEGTRVVGARLDASGNTTVAVMALQTDSTLVDLACNASRCMLLSRRGTQVVVTRFTPEGTVLDASPVVVATPPAGYEFGARSITALDDRFVVAWSEIPVGETADIRVARIGLDGVVQDPGGRPVTTVGARRTVPSLASNGSRLFLTFRAQASGPRLAGLYGLALDRELAPIASAAGILESEMSTTTALPLWDGSQWVVVDLASLVRFSADGARLDTAPIVIPSVSAGSVEANTLLSADVGGFFVMRYAVPPAGTIPSTRLWRYAQRVASNGALSGSPAALTSAYQSQTAPVTDCDGTEFATSWTPPPVIPNNPRFVRISAAGVVRDAPAVASTVDNYGLNNAAALLLEGSTLQVFGNIGNSGISQLALDMNARTTGPVTRLSTSPGRATAVRGSGQRILFFQGESGSVPTTTAIFRFDAAGARLDAASIPLPTAYTLGGDFDGTRYLMAYSAGPTGIYVRRLDASGDFTELSPRSLSTLGAVYAGLRLSFGGGTHLMTWIDASRQVRATRLGLDGAPVAATPLVLGSTGATATDVALSFNGSNFVAVWSNADDRRLRAVRVSPAGAALDATPMLLTEAQPRTRVNFSTASDTHGSTLVTYDLYVRDLGTTVVRGLFVRDDGVVVGPTDAGVDVPAVPVDMPVVAVDVPTVTDAGVADAVTTLVDAFTTPVDAFTTPVDAVTTPVDAFTTPVDAVTTLVDAVTTPVDAVTTPVDAFTTPSDAGTTPADAGTPPPADDGGLCSVQGGVGTHGPLGLRGVPGLLFGAVALLRRRRRR